MKKLLLIIACLIVPTLLAAKVQYYDIDPDRELAATPQTFYERFEIDLNDDGEIDFYFKHFAPDASTLESEVYTYPGGSGEILIDEYLTPYALDEGTEISGGLTVWKNTSPYPSSSSALFMNYNWAGMGEKYLAVRMKIDGNWHYGWIKVDVPGHCEWLTIYEFAYEDEPNTPISAGDKGASGINEDMEGVDFQIMWDGISINTDGGARLEIIDLYGNCVHKENVAGSSFVNTSALPGGCYILIIRTNEGIISRKFLIAG